MNLKFLIYIIIPFFLISITQALEVRLKEPINGTTLTTNNVVFTCKAIETSTEYLMNITLTNITLILESSNVWYSIQTKNATDDKLVNFTHTFPASGTYKWNCLAKNSNNEKFTARENYTLTINININNPPELKQTMPNKTWDKNTKLLNAFNLSNYFSDPDNDNLTFTASYSDNPHIDVIIHPNNTVDLIPIENWTGTETVIFTASDGIDTKKSNTVSLTVKEVIQNTPPRITKTIPDQVKDSDVIEWTLDLTGFESDNEDPDENLTWSVSNVNTSLITASINKQTDVITFRHIENAIGENIITLTLTDSGNLTDSQEIKIIITKKQTTQKTQEQEQPKKIQSFQPIEKTLTLSSSRYFRITAPEGLNINWYFDNELKEKNKEEYFLSFQILKLNKTHNLTVILSQEGTILDTHTWLITKKQQEPVITTQAIKEPEEQAKQEIKTKKLTPNKFVIFFKNLFKNQLFKIITLSLIGILLLFIIFKFFILRKKQYNIIKKIEQDLTKKPKKISLNKLLTKKRRDKKSSFVRDFIRKRKSWGSSKEEINKALTSKGIEKEEINKILKEENK